MAKRKAQIPIDVTHSGSAAEVRLTELGLSLEIVTDAVVYGQMQRNGTTALDPPTFPGTTAWAATIRAFRLGVGKRSWTFSNTANFCTSTSPDGEWSVAIATGDKGTGIKDQPSNFKNKRGPRARKAVEINQALLFESLRAETSPATLSKTWMLLIARQGDYVHCELKLPRILDDEGRIESWAERILIPLIKLGEVPTETRRRDLEPEGGAGEIEIEIARRAPQ